MDPKENRITIERENGTLQTYDPRRLSGVSVHREVEHEFSTGDRIQFTAPSKELKVANRELGTIESVSSEGDLSIRLDSGREVRFNIREHAHLDHGYAVTSHNSQGQTAERVLIHVDTDKSELLVNNRFAYVCVKSPTRGTTASCTEDRTSFLARSAALRRGEEEQGHSLGIGLVMICDIGDKAGRAIMRVGKSSNSAFRVSRPTVDRDAPFVASRARVVLDQLWSRPRMAS